MDKLPVISNCCGFVKDLKSATIIIAVLAIGTNPAVAWVCVRHSYTIKMSCAVTSGYKNPDIVNISLENILSFGFGTHAGLGSSCLHRNKNGTKALRMALQQASEKQNLSTYSQIVRSLGWVVIIVDVTLVIVSVLFLLSMFKKGKSIAFTFIITTLVDTLLSFIYSLMYITACIFNEGPFACCDLIFVIADFSVWTYFLLVVSCYKRSEAFTSNINSSTSDRRISPSR